MLFVWRRLREAKHVSDLFGVIDFLTLAAGHDGVRLVAGESEAW